MRHIFYFIFSLLSIQVVGQKLVASYAFDNNAKDNSGNHNHGTIHGDITPAMDRFGNPCGAYHFDGKGSFIEVPNSISLESITKNLTITLWYRFDDKKENYWLTAICKGVTNYESLENPQFRLQVQQNTFNVINTCSINIPGPSSTVSLNTEFTECDYDFQNHLFEPYTWNFFAMVYDGQKVKTYMNGKKIFEFIYSGPLTTNKSPLYIGMDEPGVSEYFEGSMDDLSIFNQALSDQEIQKEFNSGKSPNWSNEEFEIKRPENKIFNLPSTGCDVLVRFDSITIIKKSCFKVSVRQLSGPLSGSKLQAGKHLVVYEAISESGYIQHCSFYIIVQDLIPPKLFVPRDTVLFVQTATKGLRYNYAFPTANDNCGIKNIKREFGPASDDFVVVGKHIIKYTATDNNNNSVLQEFTVEVREAVTKTITQIDSSAIAVKKADNNIQQPRTTSDTIQAIKSAVIPLSDNFKKRINEEQRFLEVSSTILKAMVYDNGVYDGDTVSIFLNSGVLVSHQEVTSKGFSLNILIDSTKDNELAMYAENLGAIPPNTALLVIYDNGTRHEINLLSTLSKNGTIRIRRKK